MVGVEEMAQAVLTELHRYRSANHTQNVPGGIELADADYDEIVANTRWHPADSNDPDDWIYGDPETVPREGSIFGQPVRANPLLRPGVFAIAGQQHQVSVGGVSCG